jgi:F-type H+-transporting ATPase subunit epsilon
MDIPRHLHLSIVSPERSLLSEQVDEVVVPGVDGYFGVLPGHAPLLAVLGVGELSYRKGTETTHLFTALGFAEVQPDNVTILAEVFERPEDVDVARAEAAKRRAEERVSKVDMDMDAERARLALLKSLIRLQVATRAKIRS